jgi:hypothetical protein
MDDKDDNVVETEDTTTVVEEETPDINAVLAQLAKEQAHSKGLQDQFVKTRKELADIKKKGLEADGNWKELAEQRAKELEEKDLEITKRAREDMAKSVAARLNFRDPSMAFKLIDDHSVLDNEQLTELKLQKLISDSKFLVKTNTTKTGSEINHKSGKTSSGAMTDEEYDALDAIGKLRAGAKGLYDPESRLLNK